MKPTLTREFIADVLSRSILDPRSRALYDLCFFHRHHLRDELVADKLRLIGRLYAEYGAGLGFSPELGAHCLAKSPVDRWFSALSTAEQLDGWLLLELHKRVMDVFFDLPEAEARSLASKYLHFHFPELFCIYDSRVEAAVHAMGEGDCGFLAIGEHDPVYGRFHAGCRKLADRLAPVIGRRPSPRELDRVLRAWLDLEEAGYKGQAARYDVAVPMPAMASTLSAISLATAA
jgi:hypothetical protein